MADFSTIIQEINDDINTNGVGAITGAKLNEVLRDMIAAVNAAKTDILPDGALYGGFANPNEQTPYYGDDHRYFYLAIQQGNYPAFGGELDGNSLVLFYWLEQDQAWYSKFLAVTPIGLQNALQGYLESKYLYMSLGFDTFSPYSSYVVGDYVSNLNNEGILYKFTSNHPAGQWDDNDVAEASLLDYITDYVAKQLSGKQDTITDLATIRSGAAAGATAYQKPSGGIPKTDLASGVQTSLGKADTSIQNLSTPLSPDGTITATKANGDTITIDLNHQHPNYYSKVAETTQPVGGMLPDVVYKLGTLTGATTFSFAAAVSGNVNHYYFVFTSGSTAVVPTWPASITAWDGNCVDSDTGLPVIAASKTYEVSVLDGNAIIKEW